MGYKEDKENEKMLLGITGGLAATGIGLALKNIKDNHEKKKLEKQYDRYSKNRKH